jgi:hypothetical protein
LGLQKAFRLNPQRILNLTATGGWLVGRYNQEWHNGVAVTLSPNVEMLSVLPIFPARLRLGVEATLFYTGEASLSDRYQPVLSLGATIGVTFPVVASRRIEY